MNIIGQWVRRRQWRYRTQEWDNGKWHRIESVIAGAAITTCGRRLESLTTDEHSETEPLTRMIGQPQLCKPCG